MANPLPDTNARPLWCFHGGIHIPDEKGLSSQCPIESVPLPERLWVPLQQHIGAPTRPLVAPGERVLKGQLIAEPQGLVSAPIHAPTSGRILAIEPHPVPHPSGLSAPCFLIEADGEETWAELPPPLLDYPQLDPGLIRERIRWAGVVGLGGATFPTHVKLNSAPDRPIHTLIINGAECEPYITCDDRLMRERALHIFEGVRIIHHLLQPRVVLIGIEDNKPEAIAAMRQALAATDMGGYTEIVAIPTLYPSGGEKQLIKILSGREVPTSSIPAQIGIVCQNVGTAAAVADAVLEGRPLISRVVTVSGRAIANPSNLEVWVGTPITHLIDQCGGYRQAPAKLICGGPMMGFKIEDSRTPIAKGTNCVLALTAAESPDPGPALPCIRCGRCAEVCPANLLPQQLYWYARAKDLDRVQDYHLFDCIECGCCAYVCPSHIPLVQYYRYAKTEIWAREKERRKAEQTRTRHLAKQARLERQARERQARLQQHKEALASQDKGHPEAQAAMIETIETARQRAAARKLYASED
ncbi:electron transport complex subunit RsxC [Caldichromatium japonicum]|uniref:Ion-translocating oxidoreductase complex subunit C n=1 Tax=Caldichromatium japonicum TaxID=2699430 RepID=A0A6G7VCN5_9GAMM|nr:electron transport complex subunit RsxC [Caldichromatium japonicum]QIK37819.1 electron transport complex subunit RsxC [Caldichromatium japonicum]